MTSPDAAARDKFYEDLHALPEPVSEAEKLTGFVTSTPASAQTMLPGQECWIPNENGLLFMRTCANYRLILANIFFRFPTWEKATWMHSRPLTMSSSGAPMKPLYSRRRRKFYTDRPSTSEASSATPPPSPTSTSSVCLIGSPIRPRHPGNHHGYEALSSGQAPRLDAIPAEIYEQICPQLMNPLTALYQEMWCQVEVPQDSKDVTVLRLYKWIGNRQARDNHRGIFLSAIVKKIFTSTRINPLKNQLKQ
nr:unnamed protein product [Spirometra erinaceieuropaei]